MEIAHYVLLIIMVLYFELRFNHVKSTKQFSIGQRVVYSSDLTILTIKSITPTHVEVFEFTGLIPKSKLELLDAGIAAKLSFYPGDLVEYINPTPDVPIELNNGTVLLKGSSVRVKTIYLHKMPESCLLITINPSLIDNERLDAYIKYDRFILKEYGPIFMKLHNSQNIKDVDI